jgi:hypothetical protein
MARRGVRSPRRRLIWTEYDAVLAFTAASQWFSLDTLQTYKAAVGSTVAKATIMRTHAAVVSVTGTGSPADRLWTGFRVADVDDTAGTVFAATPTVANPRDNPYVDWAFMSRHSRDGALNFRPSYIGGTAGEPGGGITYDLRSKRKLENLTDTWALVVLQDTATTVAQTYHVFVRTLLALP